MLGRAPGNAVRRDVLERAFGERLDLGRLLPDQAALDVTVLNRIDPVEALLAELPRLLARLSHADGGKRPKAHVAGPQPRPAVGTDDDVGEGVTEDPALIPAAVLAD